MVKFDKNDDTELSFDDFKNLCQAGYHIKYSTLKFPAVYKLFMQSDKLFEWIMTSWNVWNRSKIKSAQDV